MEGLFKRLVDGVDVVYDFWDVPICGVFAFNESEFSSSLVGRVSEQFTVGPRCVSKCPYEVRSVMCRSMVCREDIFLYGSIVSGLSSCKPSCAGCGMG